MELSTFIETLSKVARRHNSADTHSIQYAHDQMALLCDAAHCGNMTKANRRQSKNDTQLIKQAHDIMVKLGAECPSPNLPMGAAMPDTKEAD